MKGCPRTWQAEAIEDGRLEGAERASFERHALGCAECRSELGELKRLRTALQQLPHHEWTPLERRRLRLGLLAEANRRTTRSRPRFVGVALAAAFAAVAVILVITLRGLWPASAMPSAVASPVYEVRAERGAEWRTEHRGAHTKTRLLSGALSVHVQKLDAKQRFVLQLPDGQLEVRGTRFSVEADERHTLSVSVSEGVVALTLPGSGKQILRAGDSWIRPGRKKEAAARRPAPLPPTTASSDAQPPREASVAHSSADSGPGRAFSLAMEAFDEGNHSLAEQRLRAFLRKYPGDSRSEDATFLCAVTRAKRGDRAGAAGWARRYLVAYPDGLRRREAEAMARNTSNGDE